jgi:hypothetical protein
MSRFRRSGSIRLTFIEEDEPRDEAPIATNLSAAAVVGRTLWTANDETAAVERLTRLAADRYGNHRIFKIKDYVDLPDDGEMDIEGLAVDGGYLWIVGSHSARRKKPRPHEHDPAIVLERLGTLEFDASRWFLGRIPLVEQKDGEGGLYELAREAADETGTREAACLPIRRKKATELVRLLVKDPHLADFMDVPAKENGFDVEGIAARGERVYLGLRGPVLRGWAIIVELKLEAKKSKLRLAPVDDTGRLYRKHFFDMDGLGIRELCWHEEDLLILAGPTMDLDGPVRLYRWEQPLRADGPVVLHRDRFPAVGDLPYGRGVDHPEGVAVLDEGRADERLILIYDSPDPERRIDDEGRSVVADSFVLPGQKAPAGGPKGRIDPADLAPEGPVRVPGQIA